jgi:hypothetical protein
MGGWIKMVFSVLDAWKDIVCLVLTCVYPLESAFILSTVFQSSLLQKFRQKFRGEKNNIPPLVNLCLKTFEMLDCFFN